MKYCKKCGGEVNKEAAVCLKCGCSIGNSPTKATGADAPSFGLALLGFLIPLVGLFIFCTWKNTCPLKGKSAGKGALIGFVTAILLSIIIPVVLFLFLMTTSPEISI